MWEMGPYVVEYDNYHLFNILVNKLCNKQVLSYDVKYGPNTRLCKEQVFMAIKNILK